MAIVETLEANHLLGEGAFRFGSPDRVVLVSGGPVSHLARCSKRDIVVPRAVFPFFHFRLKQGAVLDQSDVSREGLMRFRRR